MSIRTVYYDMRLSNPVWNYNGTTAFIGVEQREVDSRFSVLQCQINAQQLWQKKSFYQKRR